MVPMKGEELKPYISKIPSEKQAAIANSTSTKGCKRKNEGEVASPQVTVEDEELIDNLLKELYDECLKLSNSNKWRGKEILALQKKNGDLEKEVERLKKASVSEKEKNANQVKELKDANVQLTQDLAVQKGLLESQVSEIDKKKAAIEELKKEMIEELKTQGAMMLHSKFKVLNPEANVEGRMNPESVKRKRSAVNRGSSPQQAPTNDSPATPIKIVGRMGSKAQSVHESPPVKIPGSSTQPDSCDQRDEMWTSFLKEMKENFCDLTSIRKDSFPFGDLMEEQFGEELGLERSINTMLPQLIQLPFLLLWFRRRFCDYRKEKEGYDREITEVRNKLSVQQKENETYVEEISELRKKCYDCEKELEKLRLDKCEWMATESDLLDKNCKIQLKLQMEHDAHKGNVEKLNAEIEKLKVQIPLQYQAGVDSAVKQVLSSISQLKS